MLLLLPPLISYSSTRKPFHDGMGEEAATFAIDCACGKEIRRNALATMSGGTKWYRSLGRDAQRSVAEAFAFDFRCESPSDLPYAHMPNGRPAYLSLVCCSGCGSEYVIGIDFYEKQPARYIGQLQALSLVQPQRLVREKADA